MEGQVAASTQNGALQALIFLYRHVLKQPFPELEDLEHAKKSRRVPVVFARQEVTKVLAHLTGTPHLMASLLSGSGLRLMECVRLRVKDIDFAYHQVIVRDGKGAQDRVTILPQSLEEALQRQLAKAKLLHAEDLAQAMEMSICPMLLHGKTAMPEHPGSGSTFSQPPNGLSIRAQDENADIICPKPYSKRR